MRATRRGALALLRTMTLTIALSGVALVRAQESAVSDLMGRTWLLVQFQSSNGETLTPAHKAKYTLVFKADGNVAVRMDCNQGRGTWKSTARNQLEFGPLALTRMACPSSSLNKRLPQDWQYVRSYTMKDGHLFLALVADGGIYEFEPQSRQGKAASGAS